MPHPSPHLSQRSPRLPYSRADALAHLSAADPKLARLIHRAGPFTLRLASQQSPFEALTEAIIYQQLHGKAAAAIHARLIASFQPVPTLTPIHPSPQDILDCPTAQLRAAGLSAAKTLALRDLAARSLGDPHLDNTVPTLARIRRMPDEAIIDHLTQVRGIGRWTVEMFLIFRLGRPDILPTADYGVRKGFALTFQNLNPTTKLTPNLLPTPATMERRARKWSPYRSVATWYLWRACDLAKPAAKPNTDLD
jgi:DNA-3-methyladenine glycosylase II